MEDKGRQKQKKEEEEDEEEKAVREKKGEVLKILDARKEE